MVPGDGCLSPATERAHQQQERKAASPVHEEGRGTSEGSLHLAEARVFRPRARKARLSFDCRRAEPAETSERSLGAEGFGRLSAAAFFCMASHRRPRRAPGPLETRPELRCSRDSGSGPKRLSAASLRFRRGVPQQPEDWNDEIVLRSSSADKSDGLSNSPPSLSSLSSRLRASSSATSPPLSRICATSPWYLRRPRGGEPLSRVSHKREAFGRRTWPGTPAGRGPQRAARKSESREQRREHCLRRACAELRAASGGAGPSRRPLAPRRRSGNPKAPGSRPLSTKGTLRLPARPRLRPPLHACTPGENRLGCVRILKRTGRWLADSRKTGGGCKQ